MRVLGLALLLTAPVLAVAAGAAPAPAAAPPLVTTSPILGRFYHGPPTGGAFDATYMTCCGGVQFSQTFATAADFNADPTAVTGTVAAQDACAGALGVSGGTRPFTEVEPQADRSCGDAVEASDGAGHDAGVRTTLADLTSFEATFVGTLHVSGPGNAVFTVFSDDAFILGVASDASGHAATRVAGPLNNAPKATPQNGYPVVAAWNTATGGVGHGAVTISFGGAGDYPYELDYTECCSGGLQLVMVENDCPKLGSAPGCLHREPTVIDAQPVVGRLSTAPAGASLSPVLTLTAQLYDPWLGFAIPGRTIGFSATVAGALSIPLCSGVTDATGTARCSLPSGATAYAVATAALGYTASFGGDSSYEGSTGQGHLLVLNGAPFPV
jgi:hypothetical protein